MANREVYPGGIYPLQGDVVSQAGSSTVTVAGIQNTPVSNTIPLSQQTLLYDSVNAQYTPMTLSNRPSCRVAAAVNVDITTGLENGDTIDGVTLATGDRVLLTAQTSAQENGIYIVVASGAASRATDLDSSDNYVTGAFTVIEQGSNSSGAVFVVSTQGTITVGTTSVTWVKVNSGGGSRLTTTITTGSLAVNATENATVNLSKTFTLMQMTAVSSACRIRLYSTAAARTADASRAVGTPPAPGAQHGVILDLVLNTTGAFPVASFPASWLLSPSAEGSNCEASPSAAIPYAITNIGSGTTTISMTFTFLPMES